MEKEFIKAVAMGDTGSELNDIGRHRLRLTFKNSGGDTIKADITAVKSREGSNTFICYAEAEKWTEEGPQRYIRELYKELEYTKANVLQIINAISGGTYKELIIE